MKKLLIILFCFLLGCKQPSTESRIKEAIKKAVTEKNKDIEYLQIDSIHYYLSNLRTYYSSFVNKEVYYIKAMQESRKTSRLINDKPSIANLSYKIQVGFSKIAFINNLSDKLDTTKNIYTVGYYIISKSPSSSHEGHRETFLNQSNLSQVTIDFDKLYNESPAKTKIQYDSVAALNILNMVDSMEIQKTRLQNELDLIIAKGMNRGVILQYELSIARVRKDIAYQKMINSWLYD